MTLRLKENLVLGRKKKKEGREKIASTDVHLAPRGKTQLLLAVR